MIKTAVRWAIGQGLPRAVLQRAARTGDPHGRLIAAAQTGVRPDELTALFDETRAQGPLIRGQFSYVTLNHAAVREVLSSPDFRTGLPGPAGALTRVATWSADERVLSPVRPPSLLVTEPPDHTRLRKLVTRVFTARAVEQLRARTEQIAAQLLDGLDSTDPVELIHAYCGPLPVTVICEILGVPAAERQTIFEIGTSAAASLDVGLGWGQFRQVERALRRFDSWLTAHITELRANPSDNLLSQLIIAQEDGVGLTDDELKVTAGLVLAAGFETTVNLLGNGVALLCEHPDQLERLREHAELWPNAVEEILRYDPPVLLTGRIAARDTTVAGRPVAAGQLVTTVLAGANRDPEVFTDPARFDVARPEAREHLSFSAGRHHCLGAQLARMEGEIGLRMLFERYPKLTLQPGATRRSTRILRGYETLPVTLL